MLSTRRLMWALYLVISVAAAPWTNFNGTHAGFWRVCLKSCGRQVERDGVGILGF